MTMQGCFIFDYSISVVCWLEYYCYSPWKNIPQFNLYFFFYYCIYLSTASNVLILLFYYWILQQIIL